MTKGPLELRRTYPDVGAIRVSSGTHSRKVLRDYGIMCDRLNDAGRIDYLRLIRDKSTTPKAMYDRLRDAESYRTLPPPVVEPLAESVRRFLGEGAVPLVECSHAHLKNLKSYLLRLQSVADRGATAEDVPAALRKLRTAYRAADQAASFNRCRAAALLFLRETVGRRSPAYLAVQEIRTLAVTAKREPQPLTPAEAFTVALSLGDALGACWLTLCCTGMGRTEYEGHWQIEDGHLHVYGTKRRGRNRLVPLVIAPARPICSARFLHERIMEATEGRVQLYDARRTFTKWLELADVIPSHQDAYTGHGPRSMTDLYKRGNVRPYLDTDAEKIRGYLRAALANAGHDAGQRFEIAALISPQSLSTDTDAPRRSRTPNLLIRSQSLKRAGKRKYAPMKRVEEGDARPKPPEAAKSMRGRVRGLNVQQGGDE